MAGAVALEERRGAAVRLGFAHEAEQHVVVPVEDRKHRLMKGSRERETAL